MRIDELYSRFPTWSKVYTQLRITTRSGKTISAECGTFEEISRKYGMWPLSSWDYEEQTLNLEVKQR